MKYRSVTINTHPGKFNREIFQYVQRHIVQIIGRLIQNQKFGFCTNTSNSCSRRFFAPAQLLATKSYCLGTVEQNDSTIASP